MTKEITKQKLFNDFEYRMDNPHIIIEGFDTNKDIHVLCTLYYFDYLDMDKLHVEATYRLNNYMWHMDNNHSINGLKTYSSKHYYETKYFKGIYSLKVIFKKNNYDDGQTLYNYPIVWD